MATSEIAENDSNISANKMLHSSCITRLEFATLHAEGPKAGSGFTKCRGHTLPNNRMLSIYHSGCQSLQK
jgi:hypothetical protein